MFTIGIKSSRKYIIDKFATCICTITLYIGINIAHPGLPFFVNIFQYDINLIKPNNNENIIIPINNADRPGLDIVVFMVDSTLYP